MPRYRKTFRFETWQILAILLAMIALPFLSNLNSLFPVFILIISFSFGIACAILIISKNRDLAKTKALKISDIDNMTGIEFEKYIGRILQSQGYKINFTKTSNDYGVDIIAGKEKIKYAVQVKRYTKAVGRSAISDAVAGMKYYNCQRSMVVTNNYFTKLAKDLAMVNECLLIDRDKLSEWIIIYRHGN